MRRWIICNWGRRYWKGCDEIGFETFRVESWGRWGEGEGHDEMVGIDDSLGVEIGDNDVCFECTGGDSWDVADDTVSAMVSTLNGTTRTASITWIRITIITQTIANRCNSISTVMIADWWTDCHIELESYSAWASGIVLNGEVFRFIAWITADVIDEFGSDETSWVAETVSWSHVGSIQTFTFISQTI